MGLDSWRYGSVALFLREDNILGKSRGFMWGYIKSGNVGYVSSVPEIVENFFFPQSEGEKSADTNVSLQK
jgi:hypothetical protein